MNTLKIFKQAKLIRYEALFIEQKCSLAAGVGVAELLSGTFFPLILKTRPRGFGCGMRARGLLYTPKLIFIIFSPLIHNGLYTLCAHDFVRGTIVMQKQ